MAVNGCGGPGMCGHEETCIRTSCEGHPENLRWPVPANTDRPVTTPEDASAWTAWAECCAVLVVSLLAAAVAFL